MNGKISSLEAQISELKGQLHTAVQAGNEVLDRAKEIESDRQAWKDTADTEGEIVKALKEENRKLKEQLTVLKEK